LVGVDRRQLESKIEAARQVLRDVEQELSRRLRELTVGDHVDNVIIDDTTKKLFSRLKAAKGDLAELEDRLEPDNDDD
jgi:hypothetical protein